MKTPTKKIVNSGRSLTIALVMGGILLTSTEGWSQQRGKKPVVKRGPAPVVKAPPRNAKWAKPAPKIVRKPGTRNRLSIRVGKWAGITLLTHSVYNNHKAFSRLPVEVAVQLELQYHGYYHGPIDGKIGSWSIRAITSYQRSNGLVATGNIDRALLKSLNIID